jgi:hypothetical protein
MTVTAATIIESLNKKATELEWVARFDINVWAVVVNEGKGTAAALRVCDDGKLALVGQHVYTTTSLRRAEQVAQTFQAALRARPGLEEDVVRPVLASAWAAEELAFVRNLIEELKNLPANA